MTQAAAAALDDVNGTDDFIQRNTNDRQEFFNQAMARAVKPIDSHANFVMMNTFHPTEEVIEHFRKNNILTGRPFPPLDTHIRVSFGPPRRNARVLAGLGQLAISETHHAALQSVVSFPERYDQQGFRSVVVVVST